MNNHATRQQQDDQVDLIFLWQFIYRQRLFLTAALLLITALALIYTITRPVAWQSRVSILVGEDFIFQEHGFELEKPEEIRYKYSKEFSTTPTSIVVTPIKNTRIVEIRSTEEDKALAVKKVNAVMDEIINNHKEKLNTKKKAFVDILSAIDKNGLDKVGILKLLDNASASVLTKQIGNIVTTKEDASGLAIIKTIGLRLLLGMALAFLIAAIKDYMEHKIKRV